MCRRLRQYVHVRDQDWLFRLSRSNFSETGFHTDRQVWLADEPLGAFYLCLSVLLLQARANVGPGEPNSGPHAYDSKHFTH